MGLIVRTVFDSGTVVMGTSIQPQAEKIMPNHGDLIALGIEIKNDTTGTLTGAKAVCNAVDSIDLLDVNSKPLWSKIRGIDLKTLNIYGNKGRTVTETTTSTTSVSDLYYIPFRIDSSKQSCRLTVNVASYSAMATSGATAGNCRVIVTGYYDDSAGNKLTERIFRVQKSGAVGSNAFAPDIVKARKIIATYFKIGTEANLTDVVFTREGSLELQNFSLNQIKNVQNNELLDKHQTGIFNLFHSAYEWEPRTQMDFTLSGADTLDLFFRCEE